MAKNRPEFKTFLDEFDSREELDEFNAYEYVNKYTIEEEDAQNFTFEYVSFYSIDYLEQILRNDNWVNKKDDYKTYLLNRDATTCSDLNKAQYLTILAICFRSNVAEAWEILKVVFLVYLTEEDINFFRYVLTNDGQNIRSYSAHGLYSPMFYKSDAGVISAFMIFVAIMRLAVITNCFQYETE